MREREAPINPETIFGKEFRVPAIIGLGSGQGFEFSGLHLPRGWERAIPELRKIDYGRLDTLFTEYCLARGFNPGNLEYDSATGVLKELTIRTTPISMLYLDRTFPREEEGIYRARNVNDLRAAIILQRMAVVAFLNFTKQEVLYPYIDGGEEDRGYYSANLSIPREFLKPEKPLTNEYYQRRFEVRASNIAGRFGLTLKTLHFNEQGIPSPFDVEEGNACGYILDDNGKYYGHNVDAPDQVAVLHGIAASFINDLLSRKDGQYY